MLSALELKKYFLILYARIEQGISTLHFMATFK